MSHHHFSFTVIVSYQLGLAVCNAITFVETLESFHVLRLDIVSSRLFYLFRSLIIIQAVFLIITF